MNWKKAGVRATHRESGGGGGTVVQNTPPNLMGRCLDSVERAYLGGRRWRGECAAYGERNNDDARVSHAQDKRTGSPFECPPCESRDNGRGKENADS